MQLAYNLEIMAQAKALIFTSVIRKMETWTLRRNEQKQLEASEMWVWRRMELVKWTDKIKRGM